MKTILLDGTTLSKKMDGLTQYTLNILVELLKTTDYEITMIARKDELPVSWLDKLLVYETRLHIEYVNIGTIGPKRDIAFKKWYKNNKSRFDIFYEPSAQYPAGVKGGIYTVHDILYEEYPEKLGRKSRLKRLYLHHVVGRGLKKSDVTIAVSNFTKKEILKWHRTNASKIVVVSEGYEHLKEISLCPADEKVKEVRNRCNEQYFMYIGSSRGHKNLRSLFLAFEKLKTNYKLLVVGRMDRLTDIEKEDVKRINSKVEKIIFTGWLDDSQMYTLLSTASAFVFPSKSEGFGIPILESYYFNVPLLCSDIDVFNEVTNGACITFNPFDIDNIRKALESFINITPQKLDDLLYRQKEQLKLYSWEKAAKEIVSIMEETC